MSLPMETGEIAFEDDFSESMMDKRKHIYDRLRALTCVKKTFAARVLSLPKEKVRVLGDLVTELKQIRDQQAAADQAKKERAAPASSIEPDVMTQKIFKLSDDVSTMQKTVNELNNSSVALYNYHCQLAKAIDGLARVVCRPVIFHAQATYDAEAPGVLTYKVVTVNEFNDFDRETGFFRVPFTGVYHFVIESSAGANLCICETKRFAFSPKQWGRSAILDLVEKQTIYVRVTKAMTYTSEVRTSFTGIRLK